jgi:death on curing protein
MLSLEIVLQIHDAVIYAHGGARGIRDQNALLSAIARPFQGFEEEDLYKTGIEKAAAIAESIIMNHPFVDGNKRTGLVLMEAILREYNFKITCDDLQLYSFIINISNGAIRFEQIVEWLNNNTIQQ